ncbi:MAG: hypothetical protein CVU03_14185 [Bacteroidetes bacterium HGW-Bacteroidetes-2]|jgi:hypothetical protein|nr:MAG: hypothetical protein CVU03_14185 [Bacteroidetes bacterium HGW-Bacteroidetes-2]
MAYNNFFIIVALLLFGFVHSQEKNVNWSILIDGKMENLFNSKIVAEYDNGNIDTYPVKLIPGELIILSNDYSKILKAGNIKKIVLKFEFAKVCKDIKYYDYEIPIFNSWLSQSYFVLNIYNLDLKSNRKLYTPLPNKNYNYQYEFPNSGSRIIQKKLTKEQKKCNNNN